MKRIFAAALLAPLVAATTASADPGSKDWSAVADMNHGRWTHKVVVLADGRVMAIGGASTSADFLPAWADAEIWDPATNRWSLTSPIGGNDPLPVALGWTALLADGRVLAAGGWYARVTGDTRSFVYDPPTDRWIETGPLPLPMTTAVTTPTSGITLADGRVLIAGGAAVGEGVHGVRESAIFTPDPEDPARGSWDVTRDVHGNQTRMAHGREHHALVGLCDGRALVVGGFEDGMILADGGILFVDAPGNGAEIWDPATGAWSEVAEPMPSIPGEDHVAPGGGRQQVMVQRLPDCSVLIAGGFSLKADAAGNVLDYADRTSAVIFDPAAAHPWRVVGPMTTPRTNGVSARTGDGRVVMISGYDGSSCYGLPTYDLYDPRQGRFEGPFHLPASAARPKVEKTPAKGCGHPVTPVSDVFGSQAVSLPSGDVLWIGGDWDSASVEAFVPSPHALLFH